MPELTAKAAKMAALSAWAKEKVINVVEFKPAKAIKITIERPVCSGASGKTDIILILFLPRLLVFLEPVRYAYHDEPYNFACIVFPVVG